MEQTDIQKDTHKVYHINGGGQRHVAQHVSPTDGTSTQIIPRKLVTWLQVKQFFSVLSLEHNSKQTKNTTGGCTLKNQSDLFMCNSKITIRDLFYQPLHWKIDISTLLDVTPNNQWSHWLHKNTGLTQQISSETHLFMEIWYRNSLWTTRCIWTSTRGLWFRLWPRWWKNTTKTMIMSSNKITILNQLSQERTTIHHRRNRNNIWITT